MAQLQVVSTVNADPCSVVTFQQIEPTSGLPVWNGLLSVTLDAKLDLETAKLTLGSAELALLE